MPFPKQLRNWTLRDKNLAMVGEANHSMCNYKAQVIFLFSLCEQIKDLSTLIFDGSSQNYITVNYKDCPKGLYVFRGSVDVLANFEPKIYFKDFLMSFLDKYFTKWMFSLRATSFSLQVYYLCVFFFTNLSLFDTEAGIKCDRSNHIGYWTYKLCIYIHTYI